MIYFWFLVLLGFLAKSTSTKFYRKTEFDNDPSISQFMNAADSSSTYPNRHASPFIESHETKKEFINDVPTIRSILRQRGVDNLRHLILDNLFDKENWPKLATLLIPKKLQGKLPYWLLYLNAKAENIKLLEVEAPQDTQLLFKDKYIDLKLKKWRFKIGVDITVYYEFDKKLPSWFTLPKLPGFNLFGKKSAKEEESDENEEFFDAQEEFDDYPLDPEILSKLNESNEHLKMEPEDPADEKPKDGKFRPSFTFHLILESKDMEFSAHVYPTVEYVPVDKENPQLGQKQSIVLHVKNANLLLTPPEIHFQVPYLHQYVSKLADISFQYLYGQFDYWLRNIWRPAAAKFIVSLIQTEAPKFTSDMFSTVLDLIINSLSSLTEHLEKPLSVKENILIRNSKISIHDGSLMASTDFYLRNIPKQPEYEWLKRLEQFYFSKKPKNIKQPKNNQEIGHLVYPALSVQFLNTITKAEYGDVERPQKEQNQQNEEPKKKKKKSWFRKLFGKKEKNDVVDENIKKTASTRDSNDEKPSFWRRLWRKLKFWQ